MGRVAVAGLVVILLLACAGLVAVGWLMASAGAVDVVRALPQELAQEADQRGVAVCAGLFNVSSCNIAQTATRTAPAADGFDVWDWLLLLFGGIAVIILCAMAMQRQGAG